MAPDRDDPANRRQHLRSRAGLRRELQVQRTDVPPDPSRGGARGYPTWLRLRILASAANNGLDQAALDWGVSSSSIYRWQQRLHPFRMAGGSTKESLVGFDQLLLSICIFIYPSATVDEIATFIVVNGGSVYSREQITTRCNDLEMTRKRCSKEAFQAFSFRTQQRVRWFQTLPPPLGVRNIPLSSLLDSDETGFYLRDLGPKYGRGLSCLRVRTPAHYTRSEPRINVILVIEPGDPTLPGQVDGSVINPRRWFQITINNVDQYVFGDMMETVFHELENSGLPVDNNRGMMWDNLNVHKTPHVINIVEGRPTANHFWTMDRPPYHPKLAPIEYVFCELSCELSKRCHREGRNWTLIDLEREIRDILSTIGRNGSFQRTFRHCGYPY